MRRKARSCCLTSISGLDDSAWALLGDPDGRSVGVAGHPQAILYRLLAMIGVSRDAVRPLGEANPALAERARFLSQALRPANSTDAWRRERADDSLAEAAIESALAGVAVVEAADENEEALALAGAMREALETPGRTAALITPEVAVARRVAAELARWGIEVEASAGRPLGETQAGVFARLALAAARDFAPAALAALFGDRLTRLGRTAPAFDDAARALEIGILRIVLPPGGLADPTAALAAGREAAKEVHAHPARKRLTDADWGAAAALLADCAAALAPLRALGSDAPLADFVFAHRAALAALSAEDCDWRDAGGGETLEALLEDWATEIDPGFRCSLADYAALFDAVLAAERTPPSRASHPRLQILGLLEARLLAFDLALLAGLDETVWPPAAETDAFLNRSMRAALGLSPPERRIGQTAHDFVAALGAPQAIVSRARKRGGAPTVASRFLQRIAAVAGEAAYAAAKARGARYLALAQALDRPAAYRPTPPPGAEAAVGAAARSAQRHPHRDPAPRPLRDLRRAHPRTRAAARRSAPRSARARSATFGTRRCRPTARPYRRRRAPPRRARACSPRRGAFRRAARRPEFPRPALAAHRRRARRLPRFRRRAARPRRARPRRAQGQVRIPPRRRLALHPHRARRSHRDSQRRRRGADRLQDRRAAGTRTRSRSASRRN